MFDEIDKINLVAKAGFEAGIKLGAAFHQFVGLPISESNVDIVEMMIESCVRLQPYVEDVKVEIDRDVLKDSISSFGYTTLSPEMLKMEVQVLVENIEGHCRLKAKLEWDGDYPLMYIKEVELL